MDIWVGVLPVYLKMQLGDEFIMERVGVNKCELSELSEWLRNKACLQQPVKLPLIVLLYHEFSGKNNAEHQ